MSSTIVRPFTRRQLVTDVLEANNVNPAVSTLVQVRAAPL